jgi:Tfp pilus assembly PilM family ATPase
VPLPKPFDFAIVGDHDYVPQVSNLLDKTLENFSATISSARVCVDRRLALKKFIPVDKGLTAEEIKNHVEWELEQLLIAPRDEFNVDFDHIAIPNAKKDVVAFAAIRKAVVGFIVDIFQKSRLTLEFLDLDLFASIRALSMIDSDVNNGESALVEFGQAGVGISFLVDGLLAASSDLASTIDNQRVDDLSTDALALAIHAELQKLTENVEENFLAMELERVFISGHIKDKSIVDQVQKLLPSAAVLLVEPFNHVHKQLNVESQMLIDNQGEQFLSCLGMVL